MNETYLAHHGIKGMRWGIRRYQNEDGTLTSAGKARASKGGGSFKFKKPNFKFNSLKAQRSAERYANQAVTTAGGYYDQLVKDNEYITNDDNITMKLWKLEEDPEWQAIMRRNDPEYTYYDEDGKPHYRIHEYLLKKKHPVIDALDDIGSGREITTNRVTAKSLVAGLNDYAMLGQNYIKTRVTIISALMLNNQGSFKEEKRTLKKNISDGITFMKDAMQTAEDAKKYSNTASSTAKRVINDPKTQEYAEELAEELIKRYS